MYRLAVSYVEQVTGVVEGRYDALILRWRPLRSMTSDAPRMDGRIDTAEMDDARDRLMISSVQTPLPHFYRLLSKCHRGRCYVLFYSTTPRTAYPTHWTLLLSSSAPSANPAYQTKEPMTDSTKNLLEITAALTFGCDPQDQGAQDPPPCKGMVMTMTKGRRTKTNRRGDAFGCRQHPSTHTPPTILPHPAMTIRYVSDLDCYAVTR